MTREYAKRHTIYRGEENLSIWGYHLKNYIFIIIWPIGDHKKNCLDFSMKNYQGNNFPLVALRGEEKI
jgi:hypothetical protein